MKPRCELSAIEIEDLHGSLDVRLATVGIPTQPEVASRILELVGKSDSQIADYVKIVRMDAALTGRMLRLVNSAHFAQREPVTSLDRACALLGIEKLKSFTLGFYLSRAAATDPAAQLSRQVWGQSVFRACLAAELARKLAPRVATEAFVVGLMIDAGVPLMAKLVGGQFLDLVSRRIAPTKLYVSEFQSLGYTHVDVVTVLMRRWKMPVMLSRPIEWHHTQPGDSSRSDDPQALQRIAYYVGAIDLVPTGKTINDPPPLTSMASRVLGMGSDVLGDVVKRASTEYVTASAMFAQVAETVADMDGLSARVHNQLTDLLDTSVASMIKPEAAESTGTFNLGGLRVELRRETDGEAIACVFDSSNQAIIAHRFRPDGVDAEALREAIGLDPAPTDENARLEVFLRSIAA